MNTKPNSQEDAVIVLMPIRDRMEPETEFALKNNIGFNYQFFTEIGIPVDEARNRLAKRALESNADRIVWIDSDAFWLAGCLERMLSSVSANELAVIGTVYSSRMHYAPVNAWTNEQMETVPLSRIQEYDGLIQCWFIGSHLMAHSRALLERLGSNPWALAQSDYSEDGAFARRIRECGGTQYLDTRCWAFHVECGSMYVPYSPAYALIDGKVEERPLGATPMFPMGRSYGHTVNAARIRAARDSFGDDFIAGVGKHIADQIAALPECDAKHFRLPTEEELACIFGTPA